MLEKCNFIIGGCWSAALYEYDTSMFIPFLRYRSTPYQLLTLYRILQTSIILLRKQPIYRQLCSHLRSRVCLSDLRRRSLLFEPFHWIRPLRKLDIVLDESVKTHIDIERTHSLGQNLSQSADRMSEHGDRSTKIHCSRGLITRPTTRTNTMRRVKRRQRTGSHLASILHPLRNRLSIFNDFGRVHSTVIGTQVTSLISKMKDSAFERERRLCTVKKKEGKRIRTHTGTHRCPILRQ